MYAAEASRPDPPSDVAHQAAGRGAAYQQAFRTGYAERLARRRRRAALFGGAVGAAAGLATAAAIIVSIFSDPNY